VLDCGLQLRMIGHVSEDAGTLFGDQPTRGPQLHRHHRRRRFRIRPEALGQAEATYIPMPVLTKATSALQAARTEVSVSAPVVEPEAKEVSERAIAHRTARKGIRIALEILLLVLVCTHLREIRRLYLSAALAWPDWVHDWQALQSWPF
jgi:hypothetical protein